MKGCGDTVRIAECENCKTQYYAGHYRCKQKFCPECEHIKSMMWTARIMGEIQPVINDVNVHHGVLTIRSQEKLRPMIADLENAWRYMKNGNKTYRKKFKERFKGGVRSLEVKQGKGGHGWHAHYHVLMITDKTFSRDVEWLKEAWTDSTKGKGTQPYIKTVKSNTGLIEAVLEVCKYIIKFDTEYKDEKLIEMVHALHNKRRVNSFGMLYGLASKVEADVIEQDKKEGSLEDFLCAVCGSVTAKLILKHYSDVRYNYYDDVCRLEKTNKKRAGG